MKVTALRFYNYNFYIVGKGPSLEFISERDFSDGIIITLNEAIVPVEKLNLDTFIFSMQKDGATTGMDCGHRNKCQCLDGGICKYGMVLPTNKKVFLLLSETDSSDCFKDYTNRFTFDNKDYGLEWYEQSVLSAISIAKKLGAKKIFLISFDSFTHGDLTTYVPTTGSRVENHPYFVQHEKMKSLLSDIDHEFITPTK